MEVGARGVGEFVLDFTDQELSMAISSTAQPYISTYDLRRHRDLRSWANKSKSIYGRN